jgi:hypothetical protein
MGSQRNTLAMSAPGRQHGRRPLTERARSVYLQGIGTDEIIATVHSRRAPTMSATAGLRL